MDCHGNHFAPLWSPYTLNTNWKEIFCIEEAVFYPQVMYLHHRIFSFLSPSFWSQHNIGYVF